MIFARTFICLLVGSSLGIGTIRAEAAERSTGTPLQAARSCPDHGRGFVQVPGTATCMRIGGRLRGEAQTGKRRISADEIASFRNEGRLSLDARSRPIMAPSARSCGSEAATRLERAGWTVDRQCGSDSPGRGAPARKGALQPASEPDGSGHKAPDSGLKGKRALLARHHRRAPDRGRAPAAMPRAILTLGRSEIGNLLSTSALF